LNLNARAGGSGQPLINQFILNSIEVSRPPLPEQRSIANILSSLDDKIELLRKQNETLEKIAQVIFNEWFSGNKGSNIRLGDFVTIKRGGSPRPIQDFISPTGLRWLKISDATATTSPYILEIKECIKVEGLSKTIFVKTGSLVLSNSATPGVPKILAVDSCIHDGWLYFQKSKFSNEFLYLFFKHIRSQLVQQGSGSVFTNLKTDILKDFELKIPDDKKLIEFDNVAKPIFAKILNNTTQMQTLSRLGNTLLPKLIAGEIRVN
jgi:type I restriction enzyme S subunit